MPEGYLEQYHSSQVLLTVRAGSARPTEARLPQFQAFSPTSNQAGSVFLVGVHTHACVLCTYTQEIYMYRSSHINWHRVLWRTQRALAAWPFMVKVCWWEHMYTYVCTVWI